MNFTDSQLRLYLVTERGMLRGRDLTDVVMQAVEGGVTMVQLREKDISTREFIELAQSLKSEENQALSHQSDRLLFPTCFQ